MAPKLKLARQVVGHELDSAVPDRGHRKPGRHDHRYSAPLHTAKTSQARMGTLTRIYPDLGPVQIQPWGGAVDDFEAGCGFGVQGAGAVISSRGAQPELVPPELQLAELESGAPRRKGRIDVDATGWEIGL